MWFKNKKKKEREKWKRREGVVVSQKLAGRSFFAKRRRMDGGWELGRKKKVCQCESV